MSDVFLSYSSKDKVSVTRLAKDLRSRHVSVWLDEWEIEVGESITQKIEEALKQAKYIAVWLTQNSVNSGWVSKEWHAKIYQEISCAKVIILPLLGEKCDIPLFLADKKCADFAFSYKTGLDALLRSLKKRAGAGESIAFDSSTPILVSTERFLKDLEGSHIPIPLVGNLRILRSLQNLERSGKLLRLESMVPKLPIRSIYDHILSVAHSADCLLPHINFPLSGRDRVELARVIAYHDICEIILGDIPQHTKLNFTKRSRAHVTAQVRLAQLPDGEPERITYDFIGMFLQNSERNSLHAAVSTLKGQSNVKKLFYALDKIDPIIAVWRYIDYCMSIKQFHIDEFIYRMMRFFDNPQVRTAVYKNVPDGMMLDLVDQLQNYDNARAYFNDQTIIRRRLFEFDEIIVRTLIQGRGLHFVRSRSKANINKRGPIISSSASATNPADRIPR
ncbi:MAG: TIR domain-containing protein [Rhodospirillales bacterium]|nr:TIR domain-containing protein [Rhodospirillales bacterium]